VLKEEMPGAVEEKLPEPQPLQGYLVQFLFSERTEAERWSGLLIREGYSTSVSTIRRNQLVRLRVGAFSTPAEASRLLEKLQKRGLVGMVLYHVPRHHSSPAMKRAGKKPHMVLPEKTVVDKARASEEKRVEQPKTDREDGDAIVSRAVQKELPDIKPPEPKAGRTLPEKKEEAKEKTQPEVVLKKRVPAAVEEKQPAVELPKVQATHGYLVQISFSNREKAQRWSELLTQEGYSTSMSMIMGNRLVRLRIGAFPSSAEAQGLLKKLRKQGLTGFIVQAPK
jgi:cell division protein FtsN